VTDLVVHPSPGAQVLDITPESAGWSHVGFEVLGAGSAERDTGDRELCVVVVSGTAHVRSEHGDWDGLGGRADPWAGPPDAAYLPPGTHVRIEGDGEIALCWAPAPNGGATARVLPGSAIEVEMRGHGSLERTILPILMADEEADSLLVVEVRTPGGHWSSYPPHKHDRHDPPRETFLEETYYHRIARPDGFAFQRVYTEDRSLDETLTFGDRDCVLVPRGYHTVSAPPGYDLYYLNVMAGPVRQWAIANDPDHEWTLGAST
jgi:5-deoxy-glucuronate isomerase